MEVGVEREEEKRAAKVEVETTKMATTATVAKAVEDVAEGVEDGGAADRGAEVELAVKAEAGEVEGGGVAEEEGEEEEVRLACLQGLGQKPKALAHRMPQLL